MSEEASELVAGLLDASVIMALSDLAISVILISLMALNAYLNYRIQIERIRRNGTEERVNARVE